MILLAPLAACGGATGDNVTETARAATPAPTPTPAGRIADTARLLSEAQKAELSARLGALELRSGRQVVIATIPSLDGRDMDDVVDELGNRLGVHGGVLLLVAVKDRQVRLAVAMPRADC